jgi:putative nucleotidyltransferase with HDIG domain
MGKASAADLVRGASALKSLPSVYNRITEVVNHPHSSAEDIATVVTEDPSLTARLLGLVNSAFFGFPEKIDTISRAVTIMGTQQLCDLALSVAVIRLFKGIPQQLVDMESFWRHSIACGVTSRLLAKERRECNSERFFVAGLLHDIGSIILYVQAPELAKKALLRAQRRREPLNSSERKILGYDHAEVGLQLLKMWAFPDALQHAVGYHHAPLRARRFPTEAATIHIADFIVSALEFGSSGETRVPHLEAKAREHLGFKVHGLCGLVEELERQYEGVVRAILLPEDAPT